MLRAVRLILRSATSIAAGIVYTFVFFSVALVVAGLTDDEPAARSDVDSDDPITLVVSTDPVPTWVTSLYLAGLAGVLFLFGFRLWRRTR
jgi:hypothetical protein